MSDVERTAKRRKPKAIHMVPSLAKAHDVRRLRVCCHCGGLGDDRHMIRLKTQDDHWHGRCFVSAYGLPQLLRLPRTITDGLMLSDVGPKTMMAMVDRETFKKRGSP